MRNTTLICGSVAGLVIAVLIWAPAGTLADYLHAWSLWWRGGAMSSYVLAGYPLLIWGRLGKVLQFLAGLVAVLDIVGAERLRERGRTARERQDRGRDILHRQQTAIRHTVDRERALVRSVLLPRALDVEGGLTEREWEGAIEPVWLVVPPSATAAERCFHHEAFDRIGPQITDTGDGPFIRSARVVETLARQYAMGQLDPAFHEAYRRFHRRVGRFSTAAALATVASIACSCSGLFIPTRSIWPCVAYFVMLALLLVTNHATDLALRVRIWGSGGRYLAYRALAAALDRANPDHTFRAVALVCFTAGFQLDLLAS